MNFHTLKDLAREMQLHPRTVRKLTRVLGVPATVPGHACNRWSDLDRLLLLERWKQFKLKGNTTSEQKQWAQPDFSFDSKPRRSKGAARKGRKTGQRH